MNQKEYELIGNTIALTYNARTNEQRKAGIKDIALDLAYRFGQEYSNFDREKFLKICNVGEL